MSLAQEKGRAANVLLITAPMENCQPAFFMIHMKEVTTDHLVTL